jgi:hypothetical protein
VSPSLPEHWQDLSRSLHIGDLRFPPAELLYNANFWDYPRWLAAVLDANDEIVEVAADGHHHSEIPPRHTDVPAPCHVTTARAAIGVAHPS